MPVARGYERPAASAGGRAPDLGFDIFGSAQNRRHSCQLSDASMTKHPRKNPQVLALGPSCESPTPQLKRE
jgi:hypothetical protein